MIRGAELSVSNKWEIQKRVQETWFKSVFFIKKKFIFALVMLVVQKLYTSGVMNVKQQLIPVITLTET